MTATHRDAQTGFTLVELAIVLIIIGLLIGGTLKGQELINGARVTATVSQIRAIQAGALTFLDSYKGFPGDLPSAELKLPNCSSTNGCAVTSGGPEPANARGGIPGQVVGNGMIDFVPANRALVGQENVAFFVQMFAADLIDGISATNQTAGTGGVTGVNMLGSKLGSGSYFRVGYVVRPAEMPSVAFSGAANGRAGHFLALVGGSMPTDSSPFGGATGSIDAGNTGNNDDATVRGVIRGKGVPTTAAQRIDSKFDDGNPNTGIVSAANTDNTSSNTCALNTAGIKEYNTANRNNDCVIYALFAP